MSNTLYDESGLPGKAANEEPEAGVIGYRAAGRQGPMAGFAPAAILPQNILYGGPDRAFAAALGAAPGETALRERAPIKYADELMENQDYTVAPIGTAEAVNKTTAQMANQGYNPYLTKEPLSRPTDHPNLQTVIANAAQPGVQPPSSDGYLLSLLGGQ